MLEPFHPIERGIDLEAFVLEIVAQAGNHIGLVLDDQDFCYAHEFSFARERKPGNGWWREAIMRAQLPLVSLQRSAALL